MAQKCELCTKTKPEGEFIPSSSPFWVKGRINICYSCIESLVDGEDLNQVDRLMQFANMAFMPNEWRKIWKREGTKAYRKYTQTYFDFNYYKYDWGDQNEKLMGLARRGVVEAELDELKPAFIQELKVRWGNLDEIDLLWLENYYNSILADYNVDAETQRDQFRKICRMSLVIDKNLQNGNIDKDFMTQYNNFMTSALKNVEKTQTNGITSISQIVEFIERNGYVAKFYDGVPRDEIDMIIENIKEYIADLVRGETNLPEIYAQIKAKEGQRILAPDNTIKATEFAAENQFDEEEDEDELNFEEE